LIGIVKKEEGIYINIRGNAFSDTPFSGILGLGLQSEIFESSPSVLDNLYL